MSRRSMVEMANAQSAVGAAIARSVLLAEQANPRGDYITVCTGPVEEHRARYVELRDQLAMLVPRNLAHRDPARTRLIRALRAEFEAIPCEEKWVDAWHNTVITEGKNALLTHGFKGSSYTASMALGLIESTGYSSIAAGNTAANITAAGGGSPTNGWNEATTSQCAARGTPSFGTASSGSLATSSAVAFSIIGSGTMKGGFLLIRSAAGTAPSTTTGNTNGALYSAGLFSGGDRAVVNGDTLNVSGTWSL